jgi:hypothetical protein
VPGSAVVVAVHASWAVRSIASTNGRLDRTLDYPLVTRNESKGSHSQEESVFHYSDSGVELSRNFRRIFDRKAGAIENQVAFVGDVACSIRVHSNGWREAKLAERATHQWSGHLNHFHRQRKVAELLDLFRLVGNHDEPLGSAGDNLFTQEFAATSLDKCEPRRDLIGSVDCEIEARALFEIDEWYAVASSEVFAVLGSGDGANLQAMVAHLFAEKLDPKSRRRPGTKAKRHSRLDQFQRPPSGTQLHVCPVFLFGMRWHRYLRLYEVLIAAQPGPRPFLNGRAGVVRPRVVPPFERIVSKIVFNRAAVAGHGPPGNKPDLTRSRNMLITSRDRVRKLKSAGKSAEQAVAEKPFADLDPVWGNGIITSDQWTQIVYLAL